LAADAAAYLSPTGNYDDLKVIPVLMRQLRPDRPDRPCPG